MSLKPYPIYEGSGVEWLPLIPAGWAAQPLKRQLSRNDGGVWGEDPEGDAGVPVLRSTDQTADGHWSISDPAVRQLSVGEMLNSVLVSGDLLVTKSSGSRSHLGKTTLVSNEVESMGAAYSNFMQRLRVLKPCVPAYFWYVMRSNEIREQINLQSTTTTGLANLTATVIGNFLVPVPSPGEQIAISVFLNRETAEIDAFIADQEELIALLNERRAATITQAVTKGLDPTVPMKDSGVEWLGDIPADWSMSRIKHVATTHIGLTYSPDDIVDPDENGTLVLRSGNIQNGRIDLVDRVYVSSAIPSSLRVQDGDILICARNGSRSLIGKCALIGQESRGDTFGAFMTVLRSDASDYLYWILNSMLFKAQMGLFVTATINQLTNATLNNFEIPIPSPGTRRKITDHIQWEVGEIDATIADAKEAIRISRERRAALISAAVTGKIDVREAMGSRKESLEGDLVVH